MKLASASLILFLTIFHSCSSGKAKAGDSATDSADVPSAVEHQAPITPLPDTVYASASKLKFTVDTFCDSVSGEINSLTDLYSNAPGSFTFRNGLARQANFGGTVKGTPSEISIDWTFKTQEDYSETSVGRWGGGTGWTGQPLYVEWPDSCIKRFKSNGAVNGDFTGKEIMVGSLYGSVYFIDFNTGKASRNAIPVGNPIKGTISLDPTLNGNLYVGQGVPGKRPFGALAIDLYSNKQFHFFAEDPKAQRRWGAYDSSPVRLGQFLFRPGENGTVYKLIAGPGKLTMHSALRYTVNGAAPGIEASMTVYRNYGFTADNHGNILAINLNTMKPVWLYQLGDDTDATPVLEIEEVKPYLYVGCEIDRQDVGSAKFVKLNALDGSEIWKTNIDGRRMNIDKKHFDGGFYSSALPGQGNCSHLIWANCVKNTSGQNGALVAIERASGKIAYETKLKYYAWSSPVGFINEKNEMFVVTGDCSGNIYIINGQDGTILTSSRIGSNFESSPVVVGNQLVIGSRGNSIFKLSIK